MSDFEMLSIVLMILSIVVTILIAYINQSKSNRPSAKGLQLLFVTTYIQANRLSVVTYLYFYSNKRLLNCQI